MFGICSGKLFYYSGQFTPVRWFHYLCYDSDSESPQSLLLECWSAINRPACQWHKKQKNRTNAPKKPGFTAFCSVSVLLTRQAKRGLLHIRKGQCSKPHTHLLCQGESCGIHIPKGNSYHTGDCSSCRYLRLRSISYDACVHPRHSRARH